MISHRQADILERINPSITLFFDRGQFLIAGKGGEKDYSYICRNAESVGGDYSMPQIRASVENDKIVSVQYVALSNHLRFLGYQIIKEDHKSNQMVITINVRRAKK